MERNKKNYNPINNFCFQEYHYRIKHKKTQFILQVYEVLFDFIVINLHLCKSSLLTDSVSLLTIIYMCLLCHHSGFRLCCVTEIIELTISGIVRSNTDLKFLTKVMKVNNLFSRIPKLSKTTGTKRFLLTSDKIAFNIFILVRF